MDKVYRGKTRDHPKRYKHNLQSKVDKKEKLTVVLETQP